MATTAVQKFAALCMPAAAVGLAVFTADPSWSPRREHYGTWRETLEKQAAEKAAKESPPPVVPGPAVEPAPAPTPAPTPAPAPEAKKGPAPAPEAKKDPAPDAPKPALPQPEGIEFKVSGLSPCRSGAPIRTPAADRLDVTVAVSGAYKVGMNFADPDTVKEALASAPEERKTGGLLFVVPNLRSPWNEVRDVLTAGAAAGWNHIGIAVCHPDNAALGRVLMVGVPAGPPDLPKGTDPMLVVVGAGPNPQFTVNGEKCLDAAFLLTKAKALHEECELMTENYTADLARTPWTVDGTGAMAGSVVAALDALATAGVKTARIAGVEKPAAEGAAPAVPATEPAPVPEEEKK